MDITIYIQNVNALPIDASNIGKNCETKYTDTQRKNIQTDMAIPRARFGNISAITTNVNGPSEKAKKAM